MSGAIVSNYYIYHLGQPIDMNNLDVCRLALWIRRM